MAPRSVKMKPRILGFQRRVWWPKWTPASRSSRIETTDIGISSPFWLLSLLPAGLAGTGIRRTLAPPPRLLRRVGYLRAASLAAGLGTPLRGGRARAEPAHSLSVGGGSD